MQPEMIPLKGNTWPIRAQLRSLGGEFDREKKVWMVPADRIAEARELIESEPVRSIKVAYATLRKSAKPQQKKEREPGCPQIDLATLDVLIKAQLRYLHGEVSIIGRWDDNAEEKIHEFSKRIANQGGNVGWVQRTLDEFRKKLHDRTKSDWRY